MEAVALRAQYVPPAPVAAAPVEDWGWVYEDPDLRPFLRAPRARKETPLTAFA